MLTKVKAHRTEAEAEKEGDVLDYRGNAVADHEARAAAEYYTPPASVIAQHAYLQKAHKLILGVVRLLAVWPTYKDAINSGVWQTPSKAVTRKLRQVAAVTTHTFEWSPQVKAFVCTTCGRRSKTGRHTVCRPQSRYEEGQSAHSSHDMCVSINEVTGGKLFFCQRCGHYAQVRWQKLLGPCSRTPSVGTTAWYQRKRLLDGKHPGTRKAWGIPYSAIRFRTLPCEDTSLIASYGRNQFDTADADLRFEDSDEDPLEAYPNCWGFPPPSMAEEFPALDLFGAEYDPPQFDTAFGNLDEEDQGLQACGEDMGYLPNEGDEDLSHELCEYWN